MIILTVFPVGLPDLLEHIHGLDAPILVYALADGDLGAILLDGAGMGIGVIGHPEFVAEAEVVALAHGEGDAAEVTKAIFELVSGNDAGRGSGLLGEETLFEPDAVGEGDAFGQGGTESEVLPGALFIEGVGSGVLGKTVDVRDRVTATEGEFRVGAEVESGADEVLLGFGENPIAAVVAVGDKGETGVADGVLAVDGKPGIEIGIDEELRGGSRAQQGAEEDEPRPPQENDFVIIQVLLWIAYCPAKSRS